MRRFFLTLIMLTSVVVGFAQKTVVWENPAVAFSKYSTLFEVTKVEFEDNKTILSLHITYAPGQTIAFSAEARLKSNGKVYGAKSATVMELNQPFTMPESGNIDMSIIFEPLPKDTKEISFLMSTTMEILTGIHDRKTNEENIDGTYWRNDKTGDWFIGFADGKMIYDTKIWNISDQKESKGEYTITANSGNEKVTVKIGKAKKGIRNIIINGFNPVSCSCITSKYLPDYPVKDDNPLLADNNYREGDSVTIIGWYRNMTEDAKAFGNEFEVMVTDIFSDKEQKYSAKFDSSGHFVLKFPIQNSTQLYADWQRHHIMFYVEPNETYLLVKDYSSDQTLVMGKNARLQNEILAYLMNSNVPSASLEQQRVKELEYLEMCNAARKKTLQELKQLYSQHPNLSERFRNYQQEMLLVQDAGEMMQAKYFYYQLPDLFVGYVTENIWNKISGPYTLSNNIFPMLMRDYSDCLKQRLLANAFSIADIVFLADKNGFIKLSDEEQKTLAEYSKQYGKFAKELSQTKDSIRQKIIDEFNSLECVAKMDEMLKNNEKSIKEFTSTKLYAKQIDLFVNIVDSIGWNQNLRDLYISRSFSRKIDETREPLDSEEIEYIKRKVKLEAAKKSVLTLNDKYIELQNLTLSPEVLRSSDEVKGLTNGADILKKVIEPYKGKLILVDIWGTWCSPCKEALSHSQEEYEHLKKYDMVFMYFANRSDDKGWKNVIKQYKVFGDNVVHYNLPENQQKSLEQYLGVKAFPTFLLIDKDGNIVNERVDSRNLNALESIIKKIKR